MKEFDELLGVSDRLLGPDGCPWDRKQTFATLQPYLLEEVHELLEAIDLLEGKKIQEELGDCLYTLIFIAKLAERQKLFTIQDVLHVITEKLIRRHPHVFAELKIESTEEIISTWEDVKKKEGKKSPIAGIPPSLPSLSRAQKVVHKMKGAKKLSPLSSDAISEEELAARLWDLILEAEHAGIDAESALRRMCFKQEKGW